MDAGKFRMLCAYVVLGTFLFPTLGQTDINRQAQRLEPPAAPVNAFAPGDQAPTAKTGLQFARVSVWTGDPRTSPLAEVGKPKKHAFYGVHGRFSPGTVFMVIAKDRDKTFSATAKRTLDVYWASADITFPVTEIVFEGKDCPTGHLFLAAVGKNMAYRPLHPAEVTAPEKITELSERAVSKVHDFKKLPYDFPDSGFSPGETKTRVFSLSLPEGTAFLVSHKTPYRPDNRANSKDGSFCQTALLLWKGDSLDCSPDCGEEIQFFNMDNRTYCWRDYCCCACGERYVEVFGLSAEKAVSVYTNSDFGD